MCTVNSLYQKENHDRNESNYTLVQLSKYNCQSNIITTVEKKSVQTLPCRMGITKAKSALCRKELQAI